MDSSPKEGYMRVILKMPVPAQLAQELEKRLYYVADEIRSFKLIRQQDEIHALDLICEWGNEADESPLKQERLRDKINELIRNDVLSLRVFPKKVLWRSPLKRRAKNCSFAALKDAGVAFSCGEGLVGFGEPLISLSDYFDRRLRSLAMSMPGCREYRYPTLIPTRVLETFRYFESFPQFAFFVARLHNDLDVYRSFLHEYQENHGIPDGLFSHCHSHDLCLSPTMCYHTYQQFQRQELERDTIVTSKGKSFRFESRYSSGLERLWDFTIREIVFLGRREFVLESRQAFMKRAFALMVEFEVGGCCEVASDYFFATPETTLKLLSQRIMEHKYELRVPIDGSRSLAVASFNFHETFFGEAFLIKRRGGESAWSGCVGFGLERLVYAFVCQHGLDAKRWPKAVRDGVAQNHDV
ncbi:MAG TPA: hypothetical protein VK581_10880 [Chthoniobacterales bacterium]|nr:hypothetical protein [Chthoniobacterales bacterium]